MITVGLIQELNFISIYLKSVIKLTFHLKYDLKVNIYNNILNLYYKDVHIWRENISDISMLLESCDAISRIIVCIDNNTDWIHYRHIEPS